MISVSVLGIGDWGYNHLRTFQTVPDVQVVATCDLSDKLLDRARKQFPSVRTTKDATEAIDRAEAVIVSSSARSHYELARKALLADRHVLVEKPLALRVSEGEELVELAAARKRVLMVGHLLLYHPAVILAKQLIDAGEIGRPFYLYTQRLNLGRIRTDENVLWSLAPHDISMANHFFGDSPRRVAATAQAYLQKEIEDVGFLNLEYREGRLAHTHVSWLDPHKTRKLTIVGERKMLVVDDMESEEKLKIYDKGAEPSGDGPLHNLTVRYGDIRSPRVEMKEPLRLEAEHFIECCRSGATPRTDGRQGLEVLRVLEASDRSIEAGGHPVETLRPARTA